MDAAVINEIIKVGAVFDAGKIIPKWFLWSTRKYLITEVNYTWDDHDGIEKLMLFSVSDGINSYELSFNLKRLIWKLEKTCIKI